MPRKQTIDSGLPGTVRNGLLSEYFPADYSDTFQKMRLRKPALNPEELMRRVFTCPPAWIYVLMKLRNILVKPFGLKTGKLEDRLPEMIRARNDREIVIGMEDTHLNFYVSLWCSSLQNGCQMLAVTTVVRYHNTWGRMYFLCIKPIHRILVKSLLNKSLKQEL